MSKIPSSCGQLEDIAARWKPLKQDTFSNETWVNSWHVDKNL